MLLLTNTIELIMVTYHRPNDFTRCVRSILTNTAEPFHLTIIDNSCGGLDEKFKLFENKHITIHRNSANIGKGASFKRWYNQIMIHNKADYFVSIDSDLEVPPNWLTCLQIAYHRLNVNTSVGILAPAIINEPTETFEQQLATGQLVMHNIKGDFYEATPGIFFNRYTAGPLFLIDRQFYEQIGGYVSNQLYGNDDGRLCAAAVKHNRFVGIVSDVHVLHLNNDETDGYREWKRRNVNRADTQVGYWDRQFHQNNNEQ